MAEKEQMIQDGDIGSIVGVSDSCKDLIFQLLQNKAEDRPTIGQIFEHRFIVDQINKNGSKFEEMLSKSRKKSTRVNPDLQKIVSQSTSDLNSSSESNSFLRKPNEVSEPSNGMIPPTHKHQPKVIDSAGNGSENFMGSEGHQGGLLSKVPQFSQPKDNIFSKNKGQFTRTETSSTTANKQGRNSLMQDDDLDSCLDMVGKSKDIDLFDQLGSMVKRDRQSRASDIKASAAFTQPQVFIESVVVDADAGVAKGKIQRDVLQEKRDKSQGEKNGKGKSQVKEQGEGKNVMLSFGPQTMMNMPKKKTPEVHQAVPQNDMKHWESSILDDMEEQPFELEDEKINNEPYDYIVENGLADDNYFKGMVNAERREKEAQLKKQEVKTVKQKDAVPNSSKEYQKIAKVDTSNARYEFSSQEVESKVKLNPTNMTKWIDGKVNTDR